MQVSKRGRLMRALPFIVASALAMTLAAPAAAFCGFYVSGADAKLFADATQVVLMREGTRTVLSMQNDYKGPPEKFAMVIPVPVVLAKENVKTLPPEVFDKIDKLSSPRLVEYWEQDPCDPATGVERDLASSGLIGLLNTGAGGGGGAGDLGVKVEAKFAVGEYEIVILSAKDAAGLDTWLKQEKYNIPDGAEPYLRPYVTSGMKFFVAKVDTAKVKLVDGRAALSPIRFHYDADTFSLPVRLGLINSSGTQDLIVNILAKGTRYEVANYPNVTIPTNLDVAEAARGKFGEFYAALFDKTIEQTKTAVVTEYAWDAATCDPCPGPTLDSTDLATFGADAIARGTGRGPGSGAGSYVLTRLHARYSKDGMGQDLVFKTAGGIGGGREVSVPSTTGPGALEKGSHPESRNNFQARYAIRHPWIGAITCKEPKRGVWGGPPPGVDGGGARGANRTVAAQKTAFAPRGNLSLAAMLTGTSLADALGDGGGAITSSAPVASASAAAATSANNDAGTDAAAPPKKSCMGCVVGRTDGSLSAALATVLAGAAVARRRRKK